MKQRTYDWLGHTLPIALPDSPDEEIDRMVRMLHRNDLDHEMICTVGRDRIMALVKEKKRLELLLSAATHLLLAATGPDGGPTNWNDTRAEWISLFEEEGIHPPSGSH